MAVLYLSKADTVLNSLGIVRDGGHVQFYASGTSTPLDTYSDDDLITANLNPITLTAGRPAVNVFLKAADYKVVFTNSNGADSITVDPVHGALAGQYLSLKDTYGAACDGTTNDYAAIMNAHDNAPDGSTILVTGAVKFTTPLVFTRRISWLCPGVGDYFKPALTTAQDAITVTGTMTTLPINMDVNIYGLASCCSNGLVLRNVHYSKIRATVKVGAANYSFKLLGCLESTFKLVSSVNFTVPLASAGLAAKHCFVDVYNAIAHNANTHDVIFEGAGDAVTIADQVSGGDNVWTGTIEGITGKPFTVTACYRMAVRDIHLEANSAASVFTNCSMLSFECGYAIGGVISLVGCNSTQFDNWAGGITIDATSKFTRLGVVRFGANDVLSDASNSTITEVGIGADSSPTTARGGSGAPPMENIFFNPYCDVWSAGAAAAPDGWSAGAATFARNTGTVYPGNPAQQSIAVTSTATTLANMARGAPEYPYLTIVGASRWVSAMAAVYVATGQPNLDVYIFDGSSYTQIGTVTTKDAWVAVRGAALCVAGNLAVVFAPDNGAFVAGNYFVGGLSVVYGTVSPQSLCDNGRRLEHVVTAVGYTPSFKGQRAYAATKWYLAAGTSSSADWIILN